MGPKGAESGLPARPTMNLPNSLTVLRIFFVPVLIVVLLTRSPNVVLWGFPMHFEVWGVLILLAAAATDWADGYFARRNRQVTTLGILLDPIADKLLISAAFISLVGVHDFGFAEHCVGGGLHHRRVRPWKNENGAAGLRSCGADRRGTPPVDQAGIHGSAVAGGDQRASLGGAIFLPLLEPVGRPHQAAPQAEHAGIAEE